MSVNKTVENVYLRHDAVQLTRKHFWRLLGMTLLVSLISVGLEHLLIWLGNLLTTPGSVASAEPLMVEAPTAASSAMAHVMNLVSWVVSGIISSGLILGYDAQLIDAGRGGVPRVFGVFTRMRYCLKSWGLNLLAGLKTLLWLLPGLLAIIVGAELAIYGYQVAANLTIVAGWALMFGLGVPAILRYSLAPYIMAEEPDRGIRECITLSKGLMKDRKWQCFKLGIPMVLKMLGILYAFLFAGVFIIGLLGMMENLYIIIDILFYLALLPCVYFGMQMYMVYALFYLKLREPAAEAPVSYWLRKEESQSAQPVSAWLEANPAEAAASEATEVSEFPESPAELPEIFHDDVHTETNEEKKNDDE